MGNKIVFKKYYSPKTSLTMRLVGDFSTLNLNGDKIWGELSLDDINNFCTSTINDYTTRNRKFALHNTIKVVKDECSVKVYIVHVTTLAETLLCGFEKAN